MINQSDNISCVDIEAVVNKAKEQRSNPVKLTFENLEYEVPIKLSKKESKLMGTTQKRQKILKGVSGYAMPG